MLTRRAVLAGLCASLSLATRTVQSAATRERIQGAARQRFPNVMLYTHEGRRKLFYDDLIKGKLVVINMMYAQCDGVCPKSTMNLQHVHNALGDRIGRDIFMYSITLKPEHDTPAVLKEYVEERGIKPGWLFLTGKAADIEVLRRRLGFYDADPRVDADRAQHTGMVRIGNEPYDRWHMTPALGDPQPIVEAILHADRPALRKTTAVVDGLLRVG